MKTTCFAAVTLMVPLIGLTACGGAYDDRITGSYNTAYKRGAEARRAGDYERAAEQHAFAAQSGHPKALIGYGRLFAKGEGVDRDPARAAKLFEEAYEKRSSSKPKAALELANILMKGGDGPSGGVAQDEERARTLYLTALDGGEAKAASKLGRIYEKGLGVAPDPERAIAYYKEAPDNDASAARKLALLLLDAGAPRAEVDAAAARAVSGFEARAENGDEKAWLQLTEIFFNGEIVEADRSRALSYLHNLPDDLDTETNLRLARTYEELGERHEYKRRLRLAADAGSVEAQTALAKLFLKAGTSDTNGAVGRYYAERAISQKSKPAMLYLGLALVRGEVLKLDPVTGETLLRKASEDGDIDALAALGSSILSGHVRSQRPREGLDLLEDAASQGSPDAMSALGFAYQHGRGLPENRDLALEWLQKAADAGDDEARKFLERRQAARHPRAFPDQA